MKTKTLLTIFTAITVLAMTPASTLSRISVSTSNAPTSVSNFSLPQNLGAAVNLDGSDNAPALAPNGLSLYFARDAGFGSLDIWVSRRPTLTSAWGPGENLGAVINTESNENQPTLSLDGLTLLFNSSRPGGSGVGDIYLSTRSDVNNDFGWTAPVNLGPSINTTFNEIAPAYFENQTAGRGTLTLYFASDRSGNFDIYRSERDRNGNFSAPLNVTSVNSGTHDEGPAISRDGLEMLFSSYRGGGSGDRDIWVSTRSSVSADWGAPVNVTTVNSEFDDAHPAHSPDGGVIYFGSSRDGGSGSYDIYSAHRLCTGSK